MGIGRLGQLALRSSGHPIGIDFGASALKVLQISGGQTPGLIAAAALPTPDDLLYDDAKRLEFQFQALPKLIRSGGFKGKRAVCALPALKTFCKHAQFQTGDGVNVGALVRALLPREIGCSGDALVFRHVEVGACERAGGKLETICMATGRDFVERMLDAVRTAKLEPVGMHSEFQAGLRPFSDLSQQEEAGGVLYLDMGYASTKVMVAHEGKLSFARTIEVGGMHLDRAVADQLKLALVQARQHRLEMETMSAGSGQDAPDEEVLAANVADGTGDEMPGGALKPSAATAPRGSRGFRKRVMPKADLSEPLEILTDEISMCLRYHGGMFPSQRATRVVFFGGESRHRGLCHHVARTLKLSGQLADPLARVARNGKEPTTAVSFQESQPGWAVPLGLCLSPTDL